MERGRGSGALGLLDPPDDGGNLPPEEGLAGAVDCLAAGEGGTLHDAGLLEGCDGGGGRIGGGHVLEGRRLETVGQGQLQRRSGKLGQLSPGDGLPQGDALLQQALRQGQAEVAAGPVAAVGGLGLVPDGQQPIFRASPQVTALRGA